MDDARSHSPTDHVLAGIELLHRLSLVDADDQLWLQHEPTWSRKPHSEQPSALSFAFDEEADACDLSVYDPFLFSPLTASPHRQAFPREKPLPARPSSFYRASPPSTPRLTPASTPSSSPRASLLPSQPLPRSRPPSTHLGTPRSLHRAAFPSISSTLSLLEERESEHAKRSGVLVDPETDDDDDDDRASPDSTVLVHALRKPSRDSLAASRSKPLPRPRPTLKLATSSPSLSTLADLASTPASPISVSFAPTLSHHPSLASLVPSTSSPLAGPSVLPAADRAAASRWSIDSFDRPAPAATAPPSPPPKTPKRRRLFSFISMTRNRAGSLGKRLDDAPSTPALDADPFASTYSIVDASTYHISAMSSSRRTSGAGGGYPPSSPQAALSASTTSTASTVSVATLPTPADSTPDFAANDPFCPASPTFTPASFLPAGPDDEADTQGLRPTLPPPSPHVPSASFFTPAAGGSGGLLGALARRTQRRRKRKLVARPLAPGDVRRRQDGVLAWAAGFGAVRRAERRPDGSLHVYWRDWEAAERACRVDGRVHITGVGSVALAWDYL